MEEPVVGQFMIPIYQGHRKYLPFVWQGQLFQFTCLPFGLSSAPRTFTKILKPVAAQLQAKGIRCVFYLDDILIMASSMEECSRNLQFTATTLQNLGFIINQQKSQFLPTQQITYLQQ